MVSNVFEKNTLFYGDNLDILRNHLPSDCIDLIYLDPPFNSKADYNILFKERSGKESVAQTHAFSDFWSWDINAENTYLEIQKDPRLGNMITFLHGYLGKNDMMAYLVMMTIRLKELHRVLKPTGSIYLHCDSTASHYLKILMDLVFGTENFRNEIIWKRVTAHSDANRFGRVADRILFYSKTENYLFNRQNWARAEEYVKDKFSHKDKDGRPYTLGDLNPPGGRGPVYEFHGLTRPWRFTKEKILELESKGLIYTKSRVPRIIRYLDELDAKGGAAVHELWDDIAPINSMAKERMGFQTQKPVALLERIISASSNEGDLVLDPFCGCGTTIIAAQGLKRRWVGIDITHLAIALIRSRLKKNHVYAGKDYEIIGEPVDLAGAKKLAEENKYQFQYWAVSLIDAFPVGQSSKNPYGKKGADKGIDGWLTFKEGNSIDLKRIVVQVKGGHNVGAGEVRDLVGTVQNTKSAMGILITLDEPTKPMKITAMDAGYYQSPTWGHQYPQIQITTIPELLQGKKPTVPT